MSLYVQVPIQQIADGLTAIGWLSAGGGGGSASLTYSATPPTDVSNGLLWFDTTSQILKMYNAGVWATISISQETITEIQGYASTAVTKADAASMSAIEAQDARDAILGMQVATGAAGSLVTWNGTTLSVPQGIQGIQGEPGEVSLSQLTTALATKSDTSHSHTKADVGLSNVDNTTDANKPVSIAQATAIGLKADKLNPTITGLKEVSIAMGANAIDLSLGNHFTKTISSATTFTVSNIATSGTVNSFILELTNAGSATITWFSGVKWTGGTAPTLTTSGVDILGFYTKDGGTTYRGLVLAKDSK